MTSLLEGREPPPPPSSIVTFLVYALLFSIIVLQLRGMTRSAVALRRGCVPGGRLGPRWRVSFSLALNLTWALLVLVLVPKQLGLSLTVIAQGLPDLAYLLLASGVAAFGWSIVRTACAYSVLWNLRRGEAAAQVALA